MVFLQQGVEPVRQSVWILHLSVPPSCRNEKRAVLQLPASSGRRHLRRSFPTSHSFQLINKPDFLQSGDLVRFYHRELEAYIVAESLRDVHQGSNSNRLLLL